MQVVCSILLPSGYVGAAYVLQIRKNITIMTPLHWFLKRENNKLYIFQYLENSEETQQTQTGAHAVMERHQRCFHTGQRGKVMVWFSPYSIQYHRIYLPQTLCSKFFFYQFLCVYSKLFVCRDYHCMDPK